MTLLVHHSKTHKLHNRMWTDPSTSNVSKFLQSKCKLINYTSDFSRTHLISFSCSARKILNTSGTGRLENLVDYTVSLSVFHRGSVWDCTLFIYYLTFHALKRCSQLLPINMLFFFFRKLWYNAPQDATSRLCDWNDKFIKRLYPDGENSEVQKNWLEFQELRPYLCKIGNLS